MTKYNMYFSFEFETTAELPELDVSGDFDEMDKLMANVFETLPRPDDLTDTHVKFVLNKVQ